MTKTEQAKGVVESIGRGIKTVIIWTVSLAPIGVMGAVWLIGGLQILGFRMLDWVNGISLLDKQVFAWIGPEHEPLLLISWWAITLSSLPALIVAAKIMQRSNTVLRAVDAKTGQTGVWELPSERLSSMTVLDYEGNEIGTDGLHRISTYSGTQAYEADEYDSDTHTAITSWYAGEHPSDIRTAKGVVEDIRTEMYRLVNAAIDTSSSKERVAREAGMAEINESIRRRERGTLQTGETPSTPLQDYLEQKYDRQERIVDKRSENQRDLEERFEEGAEATEEEGDEQ
ncbi:hypothetical protein [Halorubrum sp. DTA46]|uniref:hypothetical protein n=1 Tax=Halorubrum sp. DTA46 TaxID=3402162 RepID=UPI003AACF300